MAPGSGQGSYDRLRERGFRRVRLINFGGAAEDRRKYANRRAEMWGRLADWLADPGGADIPDDDLLHAQLCGAGYSFNSSSQLVMEAKEKIRARLGASPDGADALALTFAESVHRDANRQALGPKTESDYAVLGQ